MLGRTCISSDLEIASSKWKSLGIQDNAGQAVADYGEGSIGDSPISVVESVQKRRLGFRR